MRVVSVTPWYDEDPTNLHTTARSLAGLVDCAVWVDGAYEHFPNAQLRSPRDQYEAIYDGCAAAGIEAMIYSTNGVGWWGAVHDGGEVAKRNFTLFLAGLMRPDWVVIVDADWEHCGNASRVRKMMRRTDARALDGWVVGWGETRAAYRWDPGMRYVRSHYYLRAGDGSTLWCPVADEIRERHGIDRQIEGENAVDDLVFDHLPRPDGFREAAARAYYELRDRRGIEDLHRSEISTGDSA